VLDFRVAALSISRSVSLGGQLKTRH